MVAMISGMVKCPEQVKVGSDKFLIGTVFRKEATKEHHNESQGRVTRMAEGRQLM